MSRIYLCWYLDNFDLSGLLPDISSMNALEIIDLHNNTLIVTIPSFLGTLPNLQQLNLADNEFSGPVPSSLSKNNKLKLTVAGNPSLCTSGKSCSSSPRKSSSRSTTDATNKKSSKLSVVLGTTIPTFLVTWIVAAVLFILRRKRNPSNTNLPLVTGGGAIGNTGVGSNGNSDGLQNFGGQMINEIMDNVGQQTFGSPSPLLDNTGLASDLYGQT